MKLFHCFASKRNDGSIRKNERRMPERPMDGRKAEKERHAGMRTGRPREGAREREKERKKEGHKRIIEQMNEKPPSEIASRPGRKRGRASKCTPDQVDSGGLAHNFAQRG
mmetsp:Transcript_41449/g.81759  ORF Transcript_41449/g.81759 Transcript_41449/m.81759 type:complete len:110 (-) Transcript_41449:322-651(-)